MKRLICLLPVVCLVSACFMPLQDPDPCAGSGVECGNFCCPSDGYVCSAGECVLTSCDSVMQLFAH